MNYSYNKFNIELYIKKDKGQMYRKIVYHTLWHIITSVSSLLEHED